MSAGYHVLEYIGLQQQPDLLLFCLFLGGPENSELNMGSPFAPSNLRLGVNLACILYPGWASYTHPEKHCMPEASARADRALGKVRES